MPLILRIYLICTVFILAKMCVIKKYTAGRYISIQVLIYVSYKTYRIYKRNTWSVYRLYARSALSTSG